MSYATIMFILCLYYMYIHPMYYICIRKNKYLWIWMYGTNTYSSASLWISVHCRISIAEGNFPLQWLHVHVCQWPVIQENKHRIRIIPDFSVVNVSHCHWQTWTYKCIVSNGPEQCLWQTWAYILLFSLIISSKTMWFVEIDVPTWTALCYDAIHHEFVHKIKRISV